jgi:RIO kinase 2
MKEYAFMKALKDADFRVPEPIDHNRHVVMMSLIEGRPLYQIKTLTVKKSEWAYGQAMDLICRLAKCGLIHCDLNEFNLMINEEGRLTLIDFPQMISTTHMNGEE